MRTLRIVAATLAVAASATSFCQKFNVFAAASLKESATEIGREFERRYPNFHVAITFGGSQQLAAQIQNGAPADVLLSAGMEPLNGLPYEPSSLRIFAYNRLALVVNPHARIRSLHELPLVNRLIVADKAVPVGNYTAQMLYKASQALGSAWGRGVSRRVVSREHDVRSVLTKVELGEADAGIVYETDALQAGSKVRFITIPEQWNVQATYPAVRFARSPNADLAKDFMRFLFEKEAQKALVDFGFTSPIIPGTSIQLSVLGRHSLLTAQSIHRLPKRSFSANEHGVQRRFTGFDLGSLLKPTATESSHTITISAGDGYSQTVDLSQALNGGAYLVDSAHGNYQIILPSKPPKFWVHWVREISVK